MDDFYLHLSGDSQEFCVEFPHFIDFSKGKWMCALKELQVQGNSKNQDFYLTADSQKRESVKAQHQVAEQVINVFFTPKN
jgi:hypothetical protein